MFHTSLFLTFCATALPLILAQDDATTAIDFAGKIPNANAFSNANSGIRCQYIGNTECRNNETPLNRFGRAFQAAGRWTVAFCRADSDGDGLTNGEELGDPCCVWTPGSAPRRTTNLSHPGLASARNTAAKCPPPPSPSASAPAAAPADSRPPTPTSASPSPSGSPVAANDLPGSGTGVGTGASDGSSTDDSATTDTTTGTGTETTTDTSTGTTPGNEGEATVEPVASPDGATDEGGEEDDGSVCFPALATVTLEDGSTVSMRDLRVGDRVQVGAGRYSEVFMFSHKLANVEYRFVTLTAVAGERSVSLSLTKGHYVYANGKAVPAGSVRVGDSLELLGENNSCATVTEIRSDLLAGLFNPQTVDGNIVVNGVKASTFTHSVKHVTAHCMMMPVRAVFRYFGFELTALEGGADAIADMLPSQV